MPKFLPSITIGVLVIFTILGIVQGGTLSNALSLNAQNVDIVGITNLLLIYFVLALLIERACQVAMTSMTFLGLAPAEDKSNVQTQSMRSLIATAICLLLATGITLSGLRLMTGVLGLVSVEDINASGVNAFLIAESYAQKLVTLKFGWHTPGVEKTPSSLTKKGYATCQKVPSFPFEFHRNFPLIH